MNKELIPLQSFETIKSELLYQLKERIGDNGELFEEDLTIVENALKALEIIKKKEINIQLLRWCFEHGNCLFYNQNQIRDKRMLEDEEYELLKEVLK